MHNFSISSANNNLAQLGGFAPVIDPDTGKITGYTTTIGGADTVFPFSNPMSDGIYQLTYAYVNCGLDNMADYPVLEELTPGTYTFFIAWNLTGFGSQILDGVVTIKCGDKTIYTSAPLDTSETKTIWTGTAIVVSDIEESGLLSVSVTKYNYKNCTVNVFTVKS